MVVQKCGSRILGGWINITLICVCGCYLMHVSTGTCSLPFPMGLTNIPLFVKLKHDANIFRS